MVDEGVLNASPCPFGDDSLVNLPFSFSHKDRSFKDERFEDISVEEDGFHGYNDAHFSYDDDDVGMDCWKLVEEPIYNSFSKRILHSKDSERPTFEIRDELVRSTSFTTYDAMRLHMEDSISSYASRFTIS